MNPQLVSIVLPIYNEAAYIAGVVRDYAAALTELACRMNWFWFQMVVATIRPPYVIRLPKTIHPSVQLKASADLGGLP